MEQKKIFLLSSNKQEKNNKLELYTGTVFEGHIKNMLFMNQSWTLCLSSEIQIRFIYSE